MQFRRILLAMALVTLCVPTVKAVPNGLETFDTTNVGANPIGNWYTYTRSGGDANVGVNTLHSASAPKSLNAIGSAIGTYAYMTLTTPVCGIASSVYYNNGGTIGFKFYMTTLPSAAGPAYLGLGNNGNPSPPNGRFVGLALTNAGEAYLANEGSGGIATGTTALATGLTTGVWYTVQIGGAICNIANSNFYVSLTTPSGTSQGALLSDITFPGANDALDDIFFDSPVTGGLGASQLFIDDVSASGIAGTVSASDTYTVTGALQGFATTPFNEVAVARITNAGATTIKTFDPGALASPLASMSNACNRLDGVMAYQKASGTTFVGALDCIDDATKTDTLKIRSGLLGDPDQSGTICVGEGFCDFDLIGDSGAYPADTCESGQNFAFPPDTGQIGNIQAIPISWETSDDGGQDSALLGFAYLNIVNGQFGTWADMQRHENGDKSCGLEVPFTSAGASSQICTWREASDGSDYAVGASQTSGSRVWRVSIDAQNQGATLGNLGQGVDGPPIVQLKVVKQLPSPYDKLNAVACAQQGESIIAMKNNGGVVSLKPLGNQLVVNWGPLAGTATARGVALSNDGLWFAYTDTSTTIKIGDALTGAITGTLTTPTGGLKEIRLDDTGQYLYVATGTQIVRFDLQTQGATTSTPVAPGTRCVDDDGNPVAATGNETQDCSIVNPDGSPQVPPGTDSGGNPRGLFGDPGAYDLTGDNDAVKGGFFLTILWVLSGAAIGASMMGGGASTKIWGAGIGGTLFFAMMVLFGNVPGEIIFLIVFLAVAAVGFRVWRGSSAEG